MTLTANEMHALPDFFRGIPDPRRAHGVRHPLFVVLAIAAGATLSGMRGYKAMASWANNLGQKARERFRCRRVDGVYVVPSESIIRDVLTRVDPVELDRALGRWNERFGGVDMTLAIDGKTMCGAVDGDGVRTHIVSVVGHETGVCYTQKKSDCFPARMVSSALMR